MNHFTNHFTKLLNWGLYFLPSSSLKTPNDRARLSSLEKEIRSILTIIKKQYTDHDRLENSKKLISRILEKPCETEAFSRFNGYLLVEDDSLTFQWSLTGQTLLSDYVNGVLDKNLIVLKVRIKADHNLEILDYEDLVNTQIVMKLATTEERAQIFELQYSSLYYIINYVTTVLKMNPQTLSVAPSYDNSEFYRLLGFVEINPNLMIGKIDNIINVCLERSKQLPEANYGIEHRTSSTISFSQITK
jgi:hypothetical protein